MSGVLQVAGRVLRSPLGLVSIVCFAGLALVAVVGPEGFGESATSMEVAVAGQPPSAEHWLGTDALGHDILRRTLAATRLSLAIAIVSVSVAAVAGSALGALVALSGGHVRRVGSAVIDAGLSFGIFLLAIFLVTIFGVGVRGVVLAVGFALAPAFARFTYSLVASVVEREHVLAARVLGLPPRTVFRTHVLPNIADSLAVVVFSCLADGLIVCAALSFLGLGVQTPSFDWGTMLTSGIRSFYLAPWAALAPTVAIVLVGAAFSLFGDVLARALNPAITRTPRRRRRLLVPRMVGVVR